MGDSNGFTVDSAALSGAADTLRGIHADLHTTIRQTEDPITRPASEVPSIATFAAQAKLHGAHSEAITSYGFAGMADTFADTGDSYARSESVNRISVINGTGEA